MKILVASAVWFLAIAWFHLISDVASQGYASGGHLLRAFLLACIASFVAAVIVSG